MMPNLAEFNNSQFQSRSRIRLLLILVTLCALFFLIIQPSLFKYLLQTSPMLWECM